MGPRDLLGADGPRLILGGLSGAVKLQAENLETVSSIPFS